jgi:hypothetical protein
MDGWNENELHKGAIARVQPLTHDVCTEHCFEEERNINGEEEI